MKEKATQLTFISQINRDGSGTEILTHSQSEELENCTIDKEYEINRLSLSNNTYIASGFNSYVVRLKTAINY